MGNVEIQAPETPSNLSKTFDPNVDPFNPAAFPDAPDNPAWAAPSDPIPSTSGFPKTKDEYRVLYHWLARYKIQDVAVPQLSLDYNAADVVTDDDVFNMRAAFSNVGRQLANVTALQAESTSFLLENIDRNGKIYIKDNRGVNSIYDYLDTTAAAWWYKNFTYAKNPHLNRASVINRALITAIIELIMLDNDHENGKNLRTDYIGGSLIKIAVPYEAGKKLLPASVQQAFETLLMEMFVRGETLSLNTTFGDMEVQNALGLYFVAEAMDNNSLRTRAATRSQEIYQKMISGAGFEKHENGADVVYQGIYLFYAGWLLTASQSNSATASLYSWLIPYVDRGCKFLNYLTVVEPNSSSGAVRITGPSHFNVANNGSPRNMIWNFGHRGYLAGAMYGANQCKTRLFNQNGANYMLFPINSNISGMRNELQSFMSPTNYINNGSNEWAINYASLDPADGEWTYLNWGRNESSVPTYSYYKQGFYSEMMTDLNNQAQWTKYPQKYSTNFIEVLEDTNEPVTNKKPWFIIGKSNNMHAIFHVGGLGWRNNESSTIAGFGGGAISSVSTVGPVIMGRERGNQTQQFTLSEWKIWPTHHMAGADENGGYFGTARDRDLNRTVTKNGNTSVSAVATGVIGPSNNKTAPNGSITGSVNYSRTLGFNQTTGISVTSVLNTNQADQATELYEIIPVYLYDDELNNITTNPEEKTVISFYKSGSWVTPSTTLTTGVTAIRLMRYNAPLYIHFSTAKSMKLSPSEFVQTVGHDSSHSRNIMIDLLGNNGATVTLPAQVSISYTMNTTAP